MNNITKVGLYIFCFLFIQFSAIHAEEPPKVKIIGVNTSALSLYESETAKKKSKKLPKSDFSSIEFRDVSTNGKRYKVLIDGKEWWVKRTQVKTDKKYQVSACMSASDTKDAAIRGAGECTSN